MPCDQSFPHHRLAGGGSAKPIQNPPVAEGRKAGLGTQPLPAGRCQKDPCPPSRLLLSFPGSVMFDARRHGHSSVWHMVLGRTRLRKGLEVGAQGGQLSPALLATTLEESPPPAPGRSTPALLLLRVTCPAPAPSHQVPALVERRLQRMQRSMSAPTADISSPRSCFISVQPCSLRPASRAIGLETLSPG